MITDPHVVSLIAVAALTGAAAAALWARGAVARRTVLARNGDSRGEPYILYFTGPNCTVCKTHQEPALSRLEGVVSVQKVDAIEQSDLAQRYDVYTVPTTVVIGSDGKPHAVNYGYAPADKLRRQLEAIA